MTNLILGFIFLIILTGCSQSELDAQSYEPDYSQGMAVYEGQCGRCHDSGKKNAPSIKDPEEWDIQTLMRPGIVGQHFSMRLLHGPSQTRLSQYDEADVLYYIRQEIGDREESY
jgi:mono/diheme cytochrome c family protein